MALDDISRSRLVTASFTLRSHNVNRRVISGAGFQFLSVGLRIVITIGSTAILARLLDPADFGHVSMATVVTELAALFANFGLTQILIQRQRISRLQLDTVFWASLALGSILATLVFSASFMASRLFNDPQVGDLLRVLCLTFLFGGLTAIPWVVQMRLMRFRTEFGIQITSTIIRTLAAIYCAYQGMGAWSLIVGALTGSLIQVVLGFLAVPYRPRFRFHSEFLTKTWRTSGSYFGGGMLFYANMNLDLILIGRYFGAESLGYYQNARSLSDEIRGRIAIPVQHVLFPAFSSLQGDQQQIQELVLRCARILSALVIPIGLGLSALAPEIVAVLFGKKWDAMVPLLTLLGIASAVRASTSIASPIINAHNEVAKGLRFHFVSVLLLASGIVIALPFGLLAVAAAQALVAFYSFAPYRFAMRLVGLDYRSMMQVFVPPFAASIGATTAVWLIRPHVALWHGQMILTLLLLSLVGLISYIIVLHIFSPHYLHEAKQLIRMVGIQRTQSK